MVERSATPSRTPGALRGAAPGTLGMVFVGGSVAVSGVLSDAPLFTAQAPRYALAAALLAVLARATGRAVRRPRGVEWCWFAGLVATGLVGFNVALVRGAEHAEPAVLGVAVASVPVVLALAGPALDGRRPRATVVAAAGLVTAGAVLVQGFGRTDLLGLAWAALALVCEAGFTLLAVPLMATHGPWGLSVHSTWLGARAFALLGAGVEGPGALWALRGIHLLALGYLAVVVTAIAFVLWYSTVRVLGAGRAGLLTGVAPVAAAGAGAVLGGPVPAPGVWTGIVVVVAGLVLGLARGRSAAGPVASRRDEGLVRGPTPP